MKQWLRPTLARRVVLALLTAFLLVWSVLLAYEYIGFKQAMSSNSGLQQLGKALHTALAELDDPEQAKTAVAATAVWLNALRHDAGQYPGNLLFQLRDRHDRPIYSSPELGALHLAGAPMQLTDSRIGKRVFWVYRQDGPRWSLRIAEPKLDDSAILSGLGGNLLPYMLISFPLVLLPIWLAVHRGLRPLRRLAARIAARQTDDLSPLGADLKYVELQPLLVAFENMLGKLRNKVQRERAFVQDAAHELRTPMAVIATQAYVMARAVDAGQRLQAQSHLDDAIARASHLTQQLLELAMLDEVPMAEAKATDVAHLLRKLLAQQVPHALLRRIDLSLDAPESLIRPLDLPAFQSIVNNLVENAVRYVPAGGRIVVTLDVSDGGMTLLVADDGPGIAEELRELVFERFYRGRGHDASGSGLGLAIVKQAAARMRGSVRILLGLDGGGCGFLVRIRT